MYIYIYICSSVPLSPSRFMRRATYHATDGTKVEVAQASANDSRGTVQRKSQVTRAGREGPENQEPTNHSWS